MNKEKIKKILAVLFSIASGTILLLQALGINSGDKTVDGWISGISALFAIGGCSALVKKK